MNTQIQDQINKVIEATDADKIEWRVTNDNVLRWVKIDEGRTFTTTIQKRPSIVFSNTSPISRFIFTIQATNPNEILLQINSANNGEYLELLKQMFEKADQSSRKSTVNAVDKLLADL
jgi:hypothetical protein